MDYDDYGDYRRLNAQTTWTKYPVSHLHDFKHTLDGDSFLDVRPRESIPPDTSDSRRPWKTAVITLFGLFEYNVMSFGLKNATQTFQRFIDVVLRDLDFAFCYIDDVLIVSSNESEHHNHL